MAAVVLIAGIVDALRARDWHRPQTIAELLLLGVVLAGLVATHSRESWLACGAATVVVLCLQLSGGRRRLWRLVAVALPAMVIAIVLLVPSLNARVADTFRPGTFAYQSGPQARIDAWRDGIDWTLQRFPIGWGLGEIEENPRYFGSTTAENVFLQVAATVGVADVLLPRRGSDRRRSGGPPAAERRSWGTERVLTLRVLPCLRCARHVRQFAR